MATTVLNQHLSGSHTYKSCTKGSGKIKLKQVKKAPPRVTCGPAARTRPKKPASVTRPSRSVTIRFGFHPETLRTCVRCFCQQAIIGCTARAGRVHQGRSTGSHGAEETHAPARPRTGPCVEVVGRSGRLPDCGCPRRDRSRTALSGCGDRGPRSLRRHRPRPYASWAPCFLWLASSACSGNCSGGGR